MMTHSGRFAQHPIGSIVAFAAGRPASAGKTRLMRRSALIEARLVAQHLRGPAPDVVTAARRLLAMQGQDFAAVKWALGVRSRAATEREVDAAFQSGALVRAWPMRGTLHVVAAEDLGWLQSLTAERTLARAQTRHRELALTVGDFTKARDLAERALAGCGAMTRREFVALLEQARISTAGQRGYHLIWGLSLQGVLCWGPIRGKEQALVLQAEWLPSLPGIERDEALACLATRYIDGHGPATAEDLAWWSGLTKTDAKRALSMAGIPSTDDGLHTGPERSVPRSDDVLLLPAFDEYFLGYADRTAIIDEEYLPRVVPGNNGVFQPLVVHKGRVAGTWKREVRGRELSVTLLPFSGMPPAVEKATRAIAAFLGLTMR